MHGKEAQPNPGSGHGVRSGPGGVRCARAAGRRCPSSGKSSRRSARVPVVRGTAWTANSQHRLAVGERSSSGRGHLAGGAGPSPAATRGSRRGSGRLAVRRDAEPGDECLPVAMTSPCRRAGRRVACSCQRRGSVGRDGAPGTPGPGSGCHRGSARTATSGLGPGQVRGTQRGSDRRGPRLFLRRGEDAGQPGAEDATRHTGLSSADGRRCHA